ncbi:MAG: hypothetical protein ACI8P0_006020, partial [Planctomycetaceae bacterium]
YIVDIVVTASAGVTNDALEAVEPFDLRALRRYDPSFISGWLAGRRSVAFERRLLSTFARRVGREGRAHAP